MVKIRTGRDGISGTVGEIMDALHVTLLGFNLLFIALSYANLRNARAAQCNTEKAIKVAEGWKEAAERLESTCSKWRELALKNAATSDEAIKLLKKLTGTEVAT